MTSFAPTVADRAPTFRRVRLDRMSALFEHLRGIDHLQDARAFALERALLLALRRDRERFSDILELSFSITERTVYAYRFSYAFPGFCASPVERDAPAQRVRSLQSDRAEAVQSALACAVPFGESVVASVRKLLRAALEPCVMQPLVGLAWDNRGEPRSKVYLQFHDAPRPNTDPLQETSAVTNHAAKHLAAQILGFSNLPAQIGGDHLHMLGLDLGPFGLTSAKLYVVEKGLSLEGTKLPVALSIHRITEDTFASQALAEAGSSPLLPAPSDIDFGLAENNLTWEQVKKIPKIKALLERAPTFSRLSEKFQIQVRRVSVSTSAEPRLTVYYALREIEEAL